MPAIGVPSNPPAATLADRPTPDSADETSELDDMSPDAPLTAPSPDEPDAADDTDPTEPEPEGDEAGSEAEAEPDDAAEDENLEAANEEDDPEAEEVEEDKDAIIERLRAQLDGRHEDAEAEAEAALEGGETEAAEEPAEVVDLGLTDDELTEAFDDPTKMRDVLTKVYSRARQDVMRSIPQIVQRAAGEQVAAREAIKTFYEANPRLKDYASFTARVINEVQGKNPTWDVKKILDAAAPLTYERLGIKLQARKVESARGKGGERNVDRTRSSLSRTGARSAKRGGRDTRTILQQELDDMLEE